jgi:quinol monooxygenase YgiN
MTAAPFAPRIAVAGTFRAELGVTPAVLAAMKQMLAASRAEEGCEAYSYACDVSDSHLIHVFEIWRDWEALKKHRNVTHFFEWRAKWPELGLGDARLTTYELGAQKSL